MSSQEALRWYKNVSGKGEGFDITNFSKASHITGSSEQKLLENRMWAMANTIWHHKNKNSSAVKMPFVSPTSPIPPKFFLKPWSTLEVNKDWTRNLLQISQQKNYYLEYEGWLKTGKNNCLVIHRHKSNSFKTAQFYSSFTNNILGKDYWIIDANEAEFVYAILQSSMFEAWYELTKCKDWLDENGKQLLYINNSKKVRGDAHFTTGMWDTFYFLNDYNPQKGAIICAGNKIRNNSHSPCAQANLDKLIDGLVDPKLSASTVSQSDRLNLLANRFQRDFSTLLADVITLYSL